jgi:hypothetical protein
MKNEDEHAIAFISAFFCVFCGQGSNAGGKPSSITPWSHWEYIATSFVAML